MNDFQIDFLALDLFKSTDERFKRALDIAFQHDAQNLLAVGRFQKAFQSGALRHGQFIGSFGLQTLLAQCFRLAF